MKVLIIEDDRALAELMAQVLEEEGFSTLVAHTLVDAREVLAQTGPEVEVVVSDLVELEGSDLLGRVATLRGLAGDRPLIVCTGRSEATSLTDDPGVTGVIIKPFDLDDLVSLVRATCPSLPR